MARLLLGSIPGRLARLAPVPVIVVGAEQDGGQLAVVEEEP